MEQNIKELTELYKARSKFDSKGKDMKTKKQDPRKVIVSSKFLYIHNIHVHVNII